MRVKYDCHLETVIQPICRMCEFELILPVAFRRHHRGWDVSQRDFRVVLNAVFYMIRDGYPWRLLPKDFPPVYASFKT